MLSSIGRFLASRLLQNPVFIVGLGRSGTTVLLQALGKHPSILSIKGESPLIYHLGALAHRLEFNEFSEWHFRSLRFSKEHLFHSLRRLSFESAYGKNWGLIQLVKRQLRGDILFWKTRFWCARTYPNSEEARGILLFFPATKFLYIFRNGIDVVESRTRYRSFRDLEFHEHCEEWARHVNKYLYLLSLKEALPIRQEDVLLNPERVFQGICRFLGTDYHPRPVEYLRSTLVHPLNEPTRNGVEVRAILRSRPPAFSKWSSEYRKTFKAICGDAMLKLGYDIPF